MKTIKTTFAPFTAITALILLTFGNPIGIFFLIPSIVSSFKN